RLGGCAVPLIEAGRVRWCPDQEAGGRLGGCGWCPDQEAGRDQLWLGDDRGTQCFLKTWWLFSGFSILMICGYTVGFPLLLGFQLRRFHQLKMVLVVRNFNLQISEAEQFSTVSRHSSALRISELLFERQ
ncbi:hypothetical protein CYMTET_35099, partial [Cymbomonas tetramitiformis]